MADSEVLLSRRDRAAANGRTAVQRGRRMREPKDDHERKAIADTQYRNYLGWALRFYDGASFPALQVIWADQHGRWPWDPSVDARVREIQPVIEDQGDPPWAPTYPLF